MGKKREKTNSVEKEGHALKRYKLMLNICPKI